MFSYPSIGFFFAVIVIAVAQRGRQPMMMPQFRQGPAVPTTPNLAAICQPLCPIPCQNLCNALPNLACLPDCFSVCQQFCVSSLQFQGAQLVSCQATCLNSTACPNLCGGLPNFTCLDICGTTCNAFCINQLTPTPGMGAPQG